MEEYSGYVGLDVHKDTIAVAYPASLRTSATVTALSASPSWASRMPWLRGHSEVMYEATDIFVHDDWERLRSKRTPRSAQRANSGAVSRSKP